MTQQVISKGMEPGRRRQMADLRDMDHDELQYLAYESDDERAEAAYDELDRRWQAREQ